LATASSKGVSTAAQHCERGLKHEVDVFFKASLSRHIAAEQLPQSQAAGNLALLYSMHALAAVRQLMRCKQLWQQL
jgi:hypothetical protein